jgi:hypothetical protein
MKKWMCYYVNSLGHRDGNEYIDAATKSEAREHYVKFFNVKSTEKIVVIPVFDGREQVKR